MKLKTYRRPDGYTIKATPKAYNLFYKKQGFQEVNENEEEKNLPDTDEKEKDFSKLTVNELKEFLTVKGISFDKNAKKEQLLKLLKEHGQAGAEENPESAEEPENAE